MKKTLIALALFAAAGAALAQAAAQITPVEPPSAQTQNAEAWQHALYPESYSGADAELEGAATGMLSGIRPMPQVNSTGRAGMATLDGTLPGVAETTAGISDRRTEVHPYRLTPTASIADERDYLDMPIGDLVYQGMTPSVGRPFR